MTHRKGKYNKLSVILSTVCGTWSSSRVIEANFFFTNTGSTITYVYTSQLHKTIKKKKKNQVVLSEYVMHLKNFQNVDNFVAKE